MITLLNPFIVALQRGGLVIGTVNIIRNLVGVVRMVWEHDTDPLLGIIQIILVWSYTISAGGVAYMFYTTDIKTAGLAAVVALGLNVGIRKLSDWRLQVLIERYENEMLERLCGRRSRNGCNAPEHEVAPCGQRRTATG